MPQASYCGPPKSSLLHHPDTRCRCVFFFLLSNQGDCADLLWLVRPSFPFSSSVRHIFVRYSMSQSVARSAWSRARGRGNEQAPPLPSSLARERPLLPSTAMRRGESRPPDQSATAFSIHIRVLVCSATPGGKPGSRGMEQDPLLDHLLTDLIYYTK